MIDRLKEQVGEGEVKTDCEESLHGEHVRKREKRLD